MQLPWSLATSSQTWRQRAEVAGRPASRRRSVCDQACNLAELVELLRRRLNRLAGRGQGVLQPPQAEVVAAAP